MKKGLLSIVIVFFSFAIGLAQKDGKAKEMLDKSSTAFSKSGDISAYFTMSVKDTSNKLDDVYDGNIDVKGTKFHIDMPDYEIWFNGKTQWVLQKSWKEVTITEPTEQEVQTLHPALIFSIYKKGCKYKYLTEKTDTKMRKIHEIELIPLDKKNNMTKIILQINTADWMPVMFHIYFANKIENTVFINKYQTKLNLSDNLFVFNSKKYPDAEINDLRN